MARRKSTANPDEVWPVRKDGSKFKEKTPPPPAERVAPRRPSLSQRGSRIEPFVATDGYINIFGENPFGKEASDD